MYSTGFRVPGSRFEPVANIILLIIYYVNHCNDLFNYKGRMKNVQKSILFHPFSEILKSFPLSSIFTLNESE